MSTNCGCNSGDCNQSGEYLMVKATPSDAGLCGNPTSLDPTKNCAKQEKMFDFAQSGFIIPLANGQTSMKVCNSGIYTTNMWLEFFNPVCKLKITAISADHTLTLVNRCPGGSAVKSNPDAGTAVPTGTKFVVCSQPDCTPGSVAGESVVNTLESLNYIPIGNMTESATTDLVQPIGHIRSNPTNSAVKKVIKRIYGVMFNAGRPVLTALGLVDTVNLSENYRRLVIHKTTKIVSWAKNRSEQAGLISGKKYLEVISSGSERLIGPVLLPLFNRTQLDQNVAPGVTPADWPSFTTSFTKAFDLSEIPEINNAPKDSEYIALARIDIGGLKTGSTNNFISVSVNGVRAGVVRTGYNDAFIQFNTIVMPIRILRSDNKLTLKLETTGTVKYHYRICVDGIFY